MKAQGAVDAAKLRHSVLGRLQNEQNDAAKRVTEWKENDDDKRTNMSGHELHSVDSDLLHKGTTYVTWLEKVTAQVRDNIIMFDSYNRVLNMLTT